MELLRDIEINFELNFPQAGVLYCFKGEPTDQAHRVGKGRLQNEQE
jgi:hypothetical protein